MRARLLCRRLPLALVAAPILLAGCAGSAAADAPAGTVHAAGATPPSAALMICSDETRGRVAGALNLDATAAPQSSWAHSVYTCSYPLPMGRLVLSVTVAPTDAAARETLAGMRAQLGTAQPEPGLGQQAYGTATGTLVAVKDNMVLKVDATALPDDLGVTHERRIDLAVVVAAGIFDCWTGTG